MKKNLIITVLFFIFLVGCSSTKTAPQTSQNTEATMTNTHASLLGEWDFTAMTPTGWEDGILTLSEEDGELQAVMTLFGDKIQLSDVKYEDNEFTFKGAVQGADFTGKCAVSEAKKMEGNVTVGGFGDFPLSATKK